jgi:hypothetical protein
MNFSVLQSLFLDCDQAFGVFVRPTLEPREPVYPNRPRNGRRVVHDIHAVFSFQTSTQRAPGYAHKDLSPKTVLQHRYLNIFLTRCLRRFFITSIDVASDTYARIISQNSIQSLRCLIGAISD